MTSPSIETTPTGSEERMAWYRQARFGLFIHWGAYSLAGVEASWSMMAPDLSAAMFATSRRISEADYVRLPERFNPVDFNAAEWVRLAQRAGMRYIIITSKHHDGFCMFDAPGTDYKITNTPFGRDVCRELAQACADAGMPLGFYYSPPDMHHPGYRDLRKPVEKTWTGQPKRAEWAGYLDYMESHIRKLLTDYGRVSILWFDGLTNHGKYDPARFHKLVHELSPATLINDRLGEGYDYITPEQFIPRRGIPTRSGKPLASMDPGGDAFFRSVSAMIRMPLLGNWVRAQMQKYGRGELELTPVYQESYPAPERFQPWETCMTMGRTWAYNPDETQWKPVQELVRNLVTVVSRGGNYLLNVGPTPQGTFPPEAVERLEQIGQWMDAHHDAIYDCTYSPLPGGDWGQAVRKGDRLYLHLFQPPADGKLVLEQVPGTLYKVRLLGGGVREFTQKGEQVEIFLPEQGEAGALPVLEVEIKAQEPGWQHYSSPEPAALPRERYARKNALNSVVINSVLNGLLACLTYIGMKAIIPTASAAVDILITVAIISFLTAWLVLGGARKEVLKRNLPRLEKPFLRLPRFASLWALVIMLAVTVVFGGLLGGALFLFSPAGVVPWVYLILKTIYTGVSGGLATLLAVGSALAEKEQA